ncbi:hypothetical protein CNEO4_370017 [Clostridium neonatale]|nr:hypothetical protein CNEO4_370017 [Clostridium neonatale]
MEDHNKRVILQLEFKNKLISQKCTKYPNCINTLPKKNYIINS